MLSGAIHCCSNLYSISVLFRIILVHLHLMLPPFGAYVADSLVRSTATSVSMFKDVVRRYL